MLMSIRKTERGFALIEFKDCYGHGCSIQKSSAAMFDALWLGIQDAQPQILASKLGIVNPETGEMSGWVPCTINPAILLTTRMHLTREQVAALLPTLQHFADTGELPDRLHAEQPKEPQ